MYLGHQFAVDCGHGLWAGNAVYFEQAHLHALINLPSLAAATRVYNSNK